VDQLFACVISVDDEGWQLKVQGVPNTVRLRYSEDNDDSRNPDLLIGNVVFVNVHNVDGNWEILSFETIRQESVRMKGARLLSWEAMTEAVAGYVEREGRLVDQPIFWSEGYHFSIQMHEGDTIELLAHPNGDVVLRDF
jgi:hypothetical protein